MFLEIKLSAKSGDVFDKVKQELLYVPEVMECHLVSGEFDYLVKARLSEMNEYRLPARRDPQAPASAESHSYIVMEEIKESLYRPSTGRRAICNRTGGQRLVCVGTPFARPARACLRRASDACFAYAPSL